MAMRTSTDAQHAVEFLSWLFGEDPDGYIYILRQRPSSDPAEARQGKQELNPATFSKPENVDTYWWHEQGHLWSQTFCTSTIKTREERNNQPNCVAIPALWVDIDGCKKLGIPGEEFYKELRDTEEVSAWTRSSENGIQGFFKLKKPFEVNGDKELFADELAGILYDICLYYGGDPKVVTLGRLMRLPGSLNVKPEYDEHYMAQARIYDDVKYTLKNLRERFKPDPDTVPRLVLYAVTRALAETYESGSRHELHLFLAGTVRKSGMNKDACKNLVKEVCKWFHDNEIDDRITAVETTYENPFEDVATLGALDKEIHLEVERAIDFWLDLKKKYCKKRGFEFIPENYDPTQPPPPEAPFWESELQTYFTGRDGNPEIFSNFVIELKGKVIKADTLQSCWLAMIKKQNDVPTLVEIPAEKLSSWQKFNAAVPVGLSLLAPAMWNQYIAYLDAKCPPLTMLESSYYGILDADKEPTILLPNVQHPNYIWTGGEDTADPNTFSRPVDREEAVEYLSTLADYYPGFHEPRFIWPSLGWLAACPISALIWQKIKGFPTLMISGLSSSGKTHLFEFILAPHFGVNTVHSYKSTTTYALRKRLVTNNICPMIIDEFRIKNDKVTGDKKANETEDMVRNLFDRHQTSQGMASGGLIKGTLCTPLCLIGEHHYTDEATVQRTFSIRLNRSWVNKVKKMSTEERRKLEAEREWLFLPKHRGILGRIIMSWVSAHLDDIPEIIQAAIDIVDETSPFSVEHRKSKGFIAIVAGHLLMSRIYADYDLKYPLSKKEMLDSLYAADTHLMESLNYDSETMRALFEATDHVIMQANRQRLPLTGILWTPDLDDEGIAYFDITRWFKYINDAAGSSLSGIAALSEKTAFKDLLKDHTDEDNSTILGFPEDHPLFSKSSCVKVNLKQVKERFGINVDQWRGLEGFEDA
jgi:hypothetical protein